VSGTHKKLEGISCNEHGERRSRKSATDEISETVGGSSALASPGLGGRKQLSAEWERIRKEKGSCLGCSISLF